MAGAVLATFVYQVGFRVWVSPHSIEQAWPQPILAVTQVIPPLPGEAQYQRQLQSGTNLAYRLRKGLAITWRQQRH